MKASERLREQARKEGKLKSGTVSYVPEKKSLAGGVPASSSIGGTINPVNPMIVNMPTVDDFKALLAKKQPKVNINLDKKPIQSMVTVNPTLVTATKKAEPLRSTAKDRKTMLYETNDSLLSPQEVLEKYRYVVNDSEMDVNTRNLAAKKGLAVTGSMRDKSIFSGERNSELVQAITALQGDLTYMTKGYARGKGYGDAYGLNYFGNKISDNYVEKNGDAQLKAAVEARKKLGQKTVEDNPLSVMAGRVMGEGIKYGAFSPLIESQVAKATTALGTRMGASTASTTAQQLYALGKYNPAISKGLQFGGNILGQQAADTLLSTPTVILEGMEAEKGSKEIAKDVAKQQAMDFGFNLGFGALQAGGKALKSASKKGPILGVDLEKIKYEHAPVDDEMIRFKQNVDTGKTYSGESYSLNPANRRMISDVSNLVGFDITGYKTNAQTNSFSHIEKRHGKKGLHDHSMSDERDWGKIQYILDNYDDVSVTDRIARGYRDSNGKNAKTVMFSKRINGTYYVVEAVPNSKRKTMEVITAYKSKGVNKKTEGVKRSNAISPQRTSDNVSQLPSTNNSISKMDGNSNQNLLNESAMVVQKQGEAGADINALSTKDIEDLHNRGYLLKKELARASKRANLNNSEKLMVTQLVNGDTTFEDVAMAAVSGDAIKRIADVYGIEKQLRQIEGTIKDFRAEKATGLKNFIADRVGEIKISKDGKNGWRDLNPFLMGRSTQERILEKVTDKGTAKRINEAIFVPIHTAERDRQLFMNGIAERVKKLNIDTKKKYAIKDASDQTYELSESGLVHYLGSKRYQLQKLERKGHAFTQQDVDLINKLRAEVSAAESVVSKEQLAKIDRGIREFQDVYKNIHPRINEVLIRNGYDPIGYIEGYFPNMFFDDATDPMGKALQKLGFDFASKELPMDIAGRTETFRPGKKWAGNLLERTSDKTDYDALRAMDKYLDDISDVIYHTDNIKKLREYEEYLRYTLSPDGVKAEADAIKKNPAFSDEEIREKLDKLYEQNKQNHTLQNYVNNIRRYTDLLAGKKHSLDRALETDVFGRSVYKAVNTLESRVGANMVAGNIGSALTNVIPITQGTSPMSTGSNLKGLKEAMQYMSKDGMDDLTQKSAFLTTRQGREMLYQTGLQKATNIAVAPMELMDKFSTQAVWRSRYYENIKRGFDEGRAILEADDYSRRLFAGRSKGAMPTYFHSKALKPLTMFQLEVNNQLDFLLKDLPKEAHGSAVKAMKIYSGVLLGAYVYNDMYEKLTGRRSALDPIGIANEAVKDFTGAGLRNTIDVGKDMIKGKGLQLTEETGKRKASEAAGKLVENIGGNVPFVGGVLFDGGRIPLSAADPGLGSVGGAVINATTGDGTWERAGSIAMKNLTNPLYYAALPFGGSQIRKTIGGLNTMAKGGSYSTTNKGQQLQFAVDKSDPANWAKAGVFGKWALPEAQEYLGGQTKAFSEKRTSTYEKLREKGIENLQAYGTIGQVMQAESSAGKRRALRLAPIKEEGRPIIYYDLLASDKDKGVMDALKQMGEDDFAIYDCVERIADSKADIKKRNVLLNSKLSEESKIYVYQEKVTKDDDERIYEFSKAGMNIDKFLEIKNYLYISANRSLPTAQKREMFVNWVLEKGYSKGQREVIFESFNIGKKYRR